MKICPRCKQEVRDEWNCASCGFVVEKIAGFPAFAADMAQNHEGFKAGYFAELAALEQENFWFRSRNKLILWAIGKFFPGAKKMIEVGCGTGYVLSGIRKEFPAMELSGSEIHSAGLGFAAQRVQNAALMQMDAREIPFRAEFDVIGAFDVLEHIDEDEAVLAEFYRALRPGGGIILTVPQHEWLWSQQDEAACHMRRYSRVELQQKIERAGFRVEMATSFVSLLLPLMVLSRRRKRVASEQYDTMSELRLGKFANAVLGSVMNCERLLIRMNLSLPAGGSLLLLARRL